VKYDQLLKEMESERVFVAFQEVSIVCCYDFLLRMMRLRVVPHW